MSRVLESRADLNSIGFDEIGNTLLSALSEMFTESQKTDLLHSVHVGDIERFCTVTEDKKTVCFGALSIRKVQYVCM